MLFILIRYHSDEGGSAGEIKMTQNQVYGTRLAKDDEEKIEMTQNQVYGTREVKADDEDIAMQANVVYGVNIDNSPLDDSYDYI